MKKLTIEYSAEAQADILELVDWLDAQSDSLGNRFRAAMQTVVADLAEEPGMGALYACDNPLLEGMRKKTIKGFPNHLIFYRVEGLALRVLRVQHGARDLPRIFRWEMNEEAVAAYGDGGEPAEYPDFGPPPGMFSITAETTKAQLEAELLKGINSPSVRLTKAQIPAYIADMKAELLARYASGASAEVLTQAQKPRP